MEYLEIIYGVIGWCIKPEMGDGCILRHTAFDVMYPDEDDFFFFYIVRKLWRAFSWSKRGTLQSGKNKGLAKEVFVTKQDLAVT